MELPINAKMIADIDYTLHNSYLFLVIKSQWNP